MQSHSDLFVSPPKRRVFCSNKNAIIYSNKVPYNVDSWITASGAKKWKEMEEMLIMPLESLQMSGNKTKQKTLTLFLYSQVWRYDILKCDFHLEVSLPETLTYWTTTTKKNHYLPKQIQLWFCLPKIWELRLWELCCHNNMMAARDFHWWVSQNLIKWENTSCYSVMWVIWPSQGRNRRYWVFSFLNVNKSVMSVTSWWGCLVFGICLVDSCFILKVTSLSCTKASASESSLLSQVWQCRGFYFYSSPLPQPVAAGPHQGQKKQILGKNDHKCKKGQEFSETAGHCSFQLIVLTEE